MQSSIIPQILEFIYLTVTIFSFNDMTDENREFLSLRKQSPARAGTTRQGVLTSVTQRNTPRQIALHQQGYIRYLLDSFGHEKFTNSKDGKLEDFRYRVLLEDAFFGEISEIQGVKR